MTIAQSISEMEQELKEAGKTASDLCVEAGIARSTYDRWKTGQTAPNMKTWSAVTDAFASLTSGRAA